MLPTDFEFIFVIAEVSGPGDERIVAASNNLDITVSSIGGLTLASVTVEGTDATAAGLSASVDLGHFGFDVIRTYPDFVTRQDIADRIGVSRQAVSSWTRGERCGNDPFPSATSLVGDGIWLWADVVEWRRRNGHEIDDDIAYPSLADHARVDAYLAKRQEITLNAQPSSERLHFAPAVTRPAFVWGMADSSQRDYSLAS